MKAVQYTELLFHPGLLTFECLRGKLWQCVDVPDLLSAADQLSIRAEERDTGVSPIPKLCFCDLALQGCPFNVPCLREMFVKGLGNPGTCFALILRGQIIAAAIFYFKPESPQRMASEYTEENLLYLSTTMSDGSDSLRLGIAAYNSSDYEKAGQIFGSIAERKGSVEAIKNLGLTYLASGDYDKALHQFDMLSDRDDIYVNWGPFYKAVTLMLRSAPGDEEGAKEILQEVVQKQLPGNKVASGWLDRW